MHQPRPQSQPHRVAALLKHYAVQFQSPSVAGRSVVAATSRREAPEVLRTFLRHQGVDHVDCEAAQPLLQPVELPPGSSSRVLSCDFSRGGINAHEWFHGAHDTVRPLA